jgi:hypothetical protein
LRLLRVFVCLCILFVSIWFILFCFAWLVWLWCYVFESLLACMTIMHGRWFECLNWLIGWLIDIDSLMLVLDPVAPKLLVRRASLRERIDSPGPLITLLSICPHSLLLIYSTSTGYFPYTTMWITWWDQTEISFVYRMTILGNVEFDKKIGQLCTI